MNGESQERGFTEPRIVIMGMGSYMGVSETTYIYPKLLRVLSIVACRRIRVALRTLGQRMCIINFFPCYKTGSKTRH